MYLETRQLPISALDGDPPWPFNSSVEYWRPLVNQMAGDLPVEFLMAWIARESDGNPCSYTSKGESGIFQLEPPDNIAQAGTSVAALRAACSGSSQTKSRDLTSDDEAEQVRSGIQYANYLRGVAHAKLDNAGASWSESSPDFWKLVKLQHGYPGPTSAALANAAAALGRPAQNWDEFVAGWTDRTDVIHNADWVGAFGGGSSSSTFVTLALGLFVAWGLYRIATK